MKKVALVFGMIVSLTAGSSFRFTAPESNTVITDWLKLQQALIRNTSKVAHVAYSRHFAYTAVAVYESVISADKNLLTLSGQLQGLKLPAAPSTKISASASANAAFAAMYRHFYGKQEKCGKLIDSLENFINNNLKNNKELSGDVGAGIAYGKKVASSIIAWSQDDGSDNTKTYSIPTGEGLWIKTPPTFANPAVPYWSANRTMVSNPSAFVLKDPVNAFSAQTGTSFYNSANEVYQVSKNCTSDQKNIGLFWDDSPNGKYLTVFGHWNSIFLQLLRQRKLSLTETAVAMVKLALCQHDAAVVCWTGKYKYNVMRPVSYINKYIDKDWTPLIETPPHPEYPAAHAMLSASAGAALENVFGSEVSFTDSGYESIGFGRRSYSSIHQAAMEAGISRLYGGIHYRTSIDAGYDMGIKCAEHVLRNIRFYRQNQ